MRRILLLAALAAAAPLQGCGDSTGSTPITAGSLAFSYTGARNGGYSANGAFAPGTDSLFPTLPFAAGVKLADPEQGTVIGIVAFAPVSATLGHQVSFLLPALAQGQTVALAASCTGPAFCPLGLVSFDLNINSANLTSDDFVITSGSLTVTSLSGGRIAGSFSGTAEDTGRTRSITITGGSFDVPLVTESQLASGRAARMPALTRLPARPPRE